MMSEAVQSRPFMKPVVKEKIMEQGTPDYGPAIQGEPLAPVEAYLGHFFDMVEPGFAAMVRILR